WAPGGPSRTTGLWPGPPPRTGPSFPSPPRTARLQAAPPPGAPCGPPALPSRTPATEGRTGPSFLSRPATAGPPAAPPPRAPAGPPGLARSRRARIRPNRPPPYWPGLAYRRPRRPHRAAAGLPPPTGPFPRGDGRTYLSTLPP